MTLHEVAEASSLVQRTADPEANIIFGTVIDKAMTDEVKITVIATGFNRDEAVAVAATPVQRGYGRPAATVDAVAPQGRTMRDLDSPTFLRRAAASPAATPTASMPNPRQADANVNLGYASLQDELDVPTFLRKQ